MFCIEQHSTAIEQLQAVCIAVKSGYCCFRSHGSHICINLLTVLRSLGVKNESETKNSFLNLAWSSELMLILVQILAATVILFISGPDACADEDSNGLRAPQLQMYLFVFRRAYKIANFIYLRSATHFTSVSPKSCRHVVLFYGSICSQKRLITCHINTESPFSCYTLRFTSHRRKAIPQLTVRRLKVGRINIQFLPCKEHSVFPL
jgi:hypothetical protein